MTELKGVELKELRTFLDDRGSLFEFVKNSEIKDNILQVTVSRIFPEAIKAFHLHKKQTDWVCCLAGHVKLVLFSNDGSAKIEFFLGERKNLLVKIPPEIWHGYKVIGNEPAVILYCTNKEYDPSDEHRRAWNFFGTEVWETKNK